MIARWREVASSVPESSASAEMISATPEVGSPAPWLIEGHGVIWVARATRSDLSLLPPELRRGAFPLIRFGLAVRYSETPVGTYNELGGALGYLRRDGFWLHIPFLPVDSPATMRGGRENWALPKVLATFTGDPDPASTFRAESLPPGATEENPPWSVSVDISPRRRSVRLRPPTLTRYVPSLGLPSIVGVEQVTPDGTRVRTGFDRLASVIIDAGPVTVDVDAHGSDELRCLFTAGRHRGIALTYRGVYLAPPQM